MVKTLRSSDNSLLICHWQWEIFIPTTERLIDVSQHQFSEIKQILFFDNSFLLLLDLEHLKIFTNHFEFDFCDAVEYLFFRYAQRIVEVHPSENESVYDDHGIITEHSDQYGILMKYRETILRNNINLTIEAGAKILRHCKKVITWSGHYSRRNK